MCCGIATLYSDGVLSQTQRLVATFLLFAVHRNEQENHNQFLVFVEEQALVEENVIDRWLLSKMITSSDVMQDIGKKTAKELSTEFEGVPTEDTTKIDIPALMRKHQQVEPPSVSAYSSSSVRCVLSAPSDGDDAQATTIDWTEDELLVESNFLASCGTYSQLKPEFVRWAPAIMDVVAQELQWIDGDDAACLLWDDTLIKSLSEEDQLREAFVAALSNPLSPTKQQMLTNKLKDKAEVPTVTSGRSGNVSTSYIVSPEQLPQLIENNSSVAVEYILKMMQTAQADQYLKAIVSMELSFHSIEVVNGLSVVADFPGDFIRSYISKCLIACENTKDKFIQVRFIAEYSCERHYLLG